MSDPIADHAASLVCRVNAWVDGHLIPGMPIGYGLLFGALTVMTLDAIRGRDWLTASWTGALLLGNLHCYRRTVRPRLERS